MNLIGVTDQRCWNAIESKRKWIRGEISYDELVIDIDASSYDPFSIYMTACLDFPLDLLCQWQIEELKRMLLEEKDELNENCNS